MKKGEWKLVDLYPGAHIRVKTGNFFHHGIYIGNGEVVQFGYPNNIYQDPKEIKVVRSPIQDFVGDASFIDVYVYSKDELKLKRKDEDIVKEALSHLGEGGYSILKNNCEHFANRCVFGNGTSEQIDDVYENVEKLLNNKK